MSLSEIQAALLSLTLEERTTLHETLYALEEGVSVEGWRAAHAILAEELTAPSPAIPAEKVFAAMEVRYSQNVA